MRRHTQKALFLNSLIPSPASAHVIRVEMLGVDDEDLVIEAVSSPPGSVTMRLVRGQEPLTLWDSYYDVEEISAFIATHELR